jgi:hypothetical protein
MEQSQTTECGSRKASPDDIYIVSINLYRWQTELPPRFSSVSHLKLLGVYAIYFCLTCFGLSFSPSSEAGVQLRQWFNTPGYGVSILLHRNISLYCFITLKLGI